MTSITLTNTGGSAIPLNFYATTVTPTLPPQRSTVGQFPSANPNWVRSIQISNQYVFISSGTTFVAISITDLIQLGLQVTQGLTWTPPVMLLNLQNASAVHSSTSAVFTANVGSEYTMTPVWQVSTNSGSTWSTVSSGGIYAISNSTSNGILVSTLTITPTDTSHNGYLYRLQTTDNAGSYGLTNGTVTSYAATLTVT